MSNAYPTTPFPTPAPVPPQQWATPPNEPAYAVLPPARPRASGLAVAALVMSGLALLGVLGIVVMLVTGPGGGYALREQVTAVVDGGVQGPDLEARIRAAVEDDGGVVSRLECPQRSTVSQGSVTVCHGTVDGDDQWTGIVFFEDDAGHFVLTEF